MAILGDVWFGPHHEKDSSILYSEVRKVKDEQTKLTLLKKRLDTYLIRQIEPMRDRDDIYAPFSLCVMTCIAIETLGRVIQPVNQFRQDNIENNRDEEFDISRKVSTYIFSKLDQRLSRKIPQAEIARFRARFPQASPKIKYYCDLFYHYLRSSFVHGYRGKNVYLKVELEEGVKFYEGAIIINPNWLWDKFKLYYESEFTHLLTVKEKTNPTRQHALEYFEWILT